MNYLSTYILLGLLWASCPVVAQTINTGFGQQGRLTFSPNEYNEPVRIMKLDGDTLLLLANAGKIDTLVDNDVCLIKLTPDGALDGSFGTNGKVRFDFPGMDYSTVADVLQLPDKRLLVLGSGYSFADTRLYPAQLTMLLPNGSMDTTFANHGTLTLLFTNLQETPHRLVLDSQNRILFAGASIDSTHTHSDDPVIARYFLDGTPDSSFGGTGKILINPYGGNQPLKNGSQRHLTGGIIYDILLQADGKILVCGGYSDGNQLLTAILRIKDDGALDLSFDLTGMVSMYVTYNANNQAVKMLPIGTDSIIFGISSYTLTGRDFYWGTLKENTGQYNIDTLDINGNEDQLTDVIQANDGSIVLAGYSKLAMHTSDAYLSDYFALAHLGSINDKNPSRFLIPFDANYQSGIQSMVQQSDGTIVCFGFVNTADPYQKNLALLAVNNNFPTGIEQPAAVEVSYKIFPNPVQDGIYIQGNGTQPNADITLADLSGRVLLQQSQVDLSTGAPHYIDLGEFPAGMYLLTTNGTVNKIIKY